MGTLRDHVRAYVASTIAGKVFATDAPRMSADFPTSLEPNASFAFADIDLTPFAVRYAAAGFPAPVFIGNAGGKGWFINVRHLPVSIGQAVAFMGADGTIRSYTIDAIPVSDVTTDTQIGTFSESVNASISPARFVPTDFASYWNLAWNDVPMLRSSNRHPDGHATGRREVSIDAIIQIHDATLGIGINDSDTEFAAWRWAMLDGDSGAWAGLPVNGSLMLLFGVGWTATLSPDQLQTLITAAGGPTLARTSLADFTRYDMANADLAISSVSGTHDWVALDGTSTVAQALAQTPADIAVLEQGLVVSDTSFAFEFAVGLDLSGIPAGATLSRLDIANQWLATSDNGGSSQIQWKLTDENDAVVQDWANVGYDSSNTTSADNDHSVGVNLSTDKARFADYTLSIRAVFTGTSVSGTAIAALAGFAATVEYAEAEEEAPSEPQAVWPRMPWGRIRISARSRRHSR